MSKKRGRKTTRMSRIQQWISRFRAIFVFRGIARRNRRKAEHQRRVHYRSEQYEIDKQRRAAKLKARNRRNRKAARKLHQKERRRAS